ncbi:MAG: hypothetical protein ABIH35_02120 [Patescibacteria group bacterium]
MSEKDFIVTATGSELPEFERPTYVVALPSKKLLDNPKVKSAIAKLAPLVHAGEPEIKFTEVDPEKLKSGKTEITCMDAREFSNASRKKLAGNNFITFAGSAFFAHPEIAQKLRDAGHDDLVEALQAILDAAREADMSIDIISNHFGEDGGCGGLNFIKNSCGGLEIPDAKMYKKLLEETRTAIGEIAQDAEIALYQTGADGQVIARFNLEDPEDMAAFTKVYDGKF